MDSMLIAKLFLPGNSFFNLEFVSYLLLGILIMSKLTIHRSSLPFALGALLHFKYLGHLFVFGHYFLHYIFVTILI